MTKQFNTILGLLIPVCLDHKLEPKTLEKTFKSSHIIMTLIKEEFVCLPWVQTNSKVGVTGEYSHTKIKSHHVKKVMPIDHIIVIQCGQ